MNERAAFRTLGSGVHTLDAPQRFYGLEVGARMTLLETTDGLFVHSPLAVPIETVREFGEPRWVLAPNLFHHLYVGQWAASGFETWGAPGLQAKRPDVAFHGEVTAGVDPFGVDIAVFPLRCFALTNEVVVFHRPSGTLVVSDLVFNFSPEAPWSTRAAMWASGAYPGCRVSVMERFGMKREVAREEIGTLLSLDFDRLVLAHGDIIEHGAKDKLRGAYRWLGV